jgi:hypothetical protein
MWVLLMMVRNKHLKNQVVIEQKAQKGLKQTKVYQGGHLDRSHD